MQIIQKLSSATLSFAITTFNCAAAMADEQGDWSQGTFEVLSGNYSTSEQGAQARKDPKPLRLDLSAEEKPALSKARFKNLHNFPEVPLSVKEGLKWIFRDEPEMASPGKEFASTCVVEKNLPRRRMIMAGLSDKFCILSYEKGGRGLSSHTLLFAREPNNKVHCLYGSPSGYSNIEEARADALKGRSGDSRSYFW